MTDKHDDIPPSSWLPPGARPHQPQQAAKQQAAKQASPSWSEMSAGEKFGTVAGGLVALIILAAVVSAFGGGDSDDGSSSRKTTAAAQPAAVKAAPAPQAAKRWRATTANVTALVEGELGAENEELHQSRVRDATCGNRTCTISYLADTPVWKVEKSLLEEARPIWEQLFADRRLRDATIITYGQTTSVGGKTHVSPVMKVTCDRSANADIDWAAIDSHGIEALCDYRAMVNF